MKPQNTSADLLREGGPNSGLTETQWQAILKQLPAPVVDNQTTPHNAGFLLGIQFALAKVAPYVRR